MTVKPRWLNTYCAAPSEEDEEIKCGNRQFMTPSGATCADGHGGAEGEPMSKDDLSTWKRNHGDKPPHVVHPDRVEAPLMPHQIIDKMAAEHKARTFVKVTNPDICPEIGGPHNYQLVNPEDEDGLLMCVDCGHKQDGDYKPDWNVGETCVIISGGPFMTVIQSDSPTSPMVECVWFNKKGNLKRSTFHAHWLRSPRPRPGS